MYDTLGLVAILTKRGTWRPFEFPTVCRPSSKPRSEKSCSIARQSDLIYSLLEPKQRVEDNVMVDEVVEAAE